ncbi:Major facilitator superfamily domain [Phytophthora cactorum]|nr:Major facilitator superfamily domain [Phytophthora cactorum]
MSTKLKDIEIRTSCAAFDSLATPETPKDGFKSPMLEEEELTPQGASFLELLVISMPRMAIRMAWAAQWAALGPYLQTMLPRYAVQLTQLSGPLSGVLMAPIVGVYSDQNTSRFGRRRPYLVVSAVGSITCWVLMGYTRELGDALGDVGSGKPGEETDRKWTALLTIFFYLWMDITVNIAQTPALLLISDFAGTRQTIGSAMGQGWSTLGAIVVAAYTEFFGAAYNSMHWFLGMLSVFMAVCIGASCCVAKEIPLDKRAMEKRSCCKNVTYAFGSIYAAVKTLPGVLVVYCTVIFLNQYAFAAYNGNKGMFFGLEVFDGDATNSATCGDECSEEQRDYNRGVRLAGGLADMLFCIVGYVYSWVLPPLVRRFGAQKIATLATIPQILFAIPVVDKQINSLGVFPLSHRDSSLSFLDFRFKALQASTTRPMRSRSFQDIEIGTSRTKFDSLATPETPKYGFKSSTLEEEGLSPQVASFLELLVISMPWSTLWSLGGTNCGAYSDRNTSSFGRRRPYLVAAAVGSITSWILMGYTRELGDALGDVGSGKPGEVTDRKWTALLTVFFYFWTGFMIHLARTPAMVLISDFAGQHQTVGAALGQGWSVLGAVVVAAYTECFGAAYNSLAWFMGMLSIVMAVSIGAACYVAKETPLDKRTTEKRSCCQNVTSTFGAILSAVRSFPKVLVVYCIVVFFTQYAYAAYNGNKGMFFGIEVFDGDAANAATCDAECSEEQLDYNRGVRLAGGVADILFCVVGNSSDLLMIMAFCDVVVLDVAIGALTSITVGTFFALIVPLIVHVFGHTTDIGVYVGVLTSVTSSGQLLNFIVGSALVETSLGFRLPVFVGGAVSLLAFLICVFFFRVKMYSM